MLLDTHTLLWFLEDNAKLSLNAKQQIEQADRTYISIISIWEIAIKIGIGKLKVEFDFKDLPQILLQLNIEILPITFADTEIYIGLPLHHRDPFDRILIAQAINYELAIIGCDVAFDAYSVQRIWE
ncbi:MAG: type II toxin-antitoxin system VapC family toxin [Pseudanabaenaceae cyanobacterium bins.39]|nr:type II toxin-antitoxin system VapC family toxin [Pseudanabaenaceae cyanobacterium bins.39]